MYIDKLDDIVNNRYIYQNEIDKLYFQNDMTYVDFKYLPRRTASDKIKHLILLKTRNDGHQRGLASMVYNFFDNKKLLVVILKMRFLGCWSCWYAIK